MAITRLGPNQSVNLASNVTRTLPAANGGTGATSFTSPKILQVVQASTTTETVKTNSTFSDTGLTADITPSATSSKVLIFVNCGGVGKATTDTYAQLKLLRGSTGLVTFEQRGGYTGGTVANKVGSCSTFYEDSPSTTSATTYKVQLRSGNNSTYAQMGDSASTSSIVLMEIAG